MKNLRIQIVTVLLSVVSFLLMIFPKISIIPNVSFLKLELSIVILIYVLYVFGLKQAFLALFYRSILHLIFLNAGLETFIGLPINIVGAIVILLSYFWLQNKKYWLQIIASSVLLTIVMIVVNLFVAIPLYAQFMNFDIGKTFGTFNYLAYAITPFNLIEGVVIGIFYILLRSSLKKSTVIDLINR